MAYHFLDNIYSKSLTPREPNLELLDASTERNIIVCLGNNSGKTFITSKLIEDLIHKKNPNEGTITLYVSDSPSVVSRQAAFYQRLTNMVVKEYHNFNEAHMIKFKKKARTDQIVVAETEVAVSFLENNLLFMSDINLIILHDCHNILKSSSVSIKELMKFYFNSDKRPHVLGLTSSLLSSNLDVNNIRASLKKMEQLLDCTVETASNVLSLLRYGTPPHEVLIEYGPCLPVEMNRVIEDEINCALRFINDHQYNPLEMYEEFVEELENMPDPKKEPRETLLELLNALHTFGLWSADRAALVLQIQIEKLKVNTPYERHFLLLCMTSTVLVKIRTILDNFFKNINDKDKIYEYSSPKILRVIEILSKFTPEKSNETNETHETHGDCSNQSASQASLNAAITGSDNFSSQSNNDTSGDAKSEGSKINEVNTIENYLQYHEYLLLPKFKVDRHARYDRFSAFNQSTGDGQDEFLFKQLKNYNEGDGQLCGLIFVEKRFTAKVLFHVLNDLKQADEDFSFLSVQFTVGKEVDGSKDPRSAENEYKKQELMLKKFRTRTCNLLIGTSFLEEGIDLPKCNLVIRFDTPPNYQSYVNTKERARAAGSLYCLMVDSSCRNSYVRDIGKYYETETMLLEKCSHIEPSESEENEADQYSPLVEPFCPLQRRDCPYVDLSTAVALVNRYCAKLPSDTFTRLTPTWNIETVNIFGKDLFICKIRLPINSPVKQEIQGCPMPTRVLARRFAALQCCLILHNSGELDDTLQPISKESFWMREEEQHKMSNEEIEDLISMDSFEPRPGTTKRRQYYYKKIAESLTDCLPVSGEKSFLHNISMALTCPLPEEQNTRGRKIYPPEDSDQGFGILTKKIIPKIGPFPIFTRSGEVQVELQLAQSTVILTELQIEKIVAFIHYTFTSVLRLQKYLMMFDPNASENSYFIVPTKLGKDSKTFEVDWNFLELIYEKRNQVPVFIPEEVRKNFVFDPTQFEDAVVSPWYRNQDQPQYLYVAEICNNLNPLSSFPGNQYNTFEEYYFKKFNIMIQNKEQALLDVDHTSARLNFLTPRYVNRKGVALPTTSAEKKKAKRENLKQKQILVPELCDIHPFPATLWRKAVCLPCILHRINALLLADELRRIVASEIGIGSTELSSDFNWKPLNFGWSLADVLIQTKETQKEQEVLEINKKNEEIKDGISKCNGELESTENDNKSGKVENGDECENKDGSWLEIGTWSNEMANNKVQNSDLMDDTDEIDEIILPNNVTMIKNLDINGIKGWESHISSTSTDLVKYNSSNSWNMDTQENYIDNESNTDCYSESSYSDDDYFDTSSDSETDSKCGGLKIEFKNDNVAEAVESSTAAKILKESNDVQDNQPWCFVECENDSSCLNEFNEKLKKRAEELINSDRFFAVDKKFEFDRSVALQKNNNTISGCKMIDSSAANETPFGNADNVCPKPPKVIPDTVKNLPHTEIILQSLKREGKILRNKNQSNNVNNKVEKKIVVDGGPYSELDEYCKNFSFDEQPDLEGHPGPSPSLILQALTMSNANDGINLERLETIGDSFLKYAITTYLYCVYENVHEGKLSHLRSKQVGVDYSVSNFNLYKLGRKKVLGERMIATKFEPHDNWLPPCYYVPRELERALIEAGVPASHWNRADLPSLRNLTKEEISQLVREKGEKLGIVFSDDGISNTTVPCLNLENMPCFIPYNLMTQHSIPDKSIADCVEALIGAYLVACGPRGALLFMSWLGIKVLPKKEILFNSENHPNIRKDVGCSLPTKVTTDEGEVWSQVCFGELESPKGPLLYHVKNPEGELERLLRGFDVFEDSLKYRFRNRSYLLQALTHASYSPNKLTDCYQRLEFLGDAVLDYLITRHLYEDSRHHSPGALTDLRSALVNNTIFASLAVRHNFHKYFRHLCPSLNEVVDRFVRFQEEKGPYISEEFYLIEEDECEETEDVEVPKALGDVFESVAGAIFLDSKMSLDAVWKVYYKIMKNEIELFSTNVPKSPIRELFELEPETAQFGKPEKLADGRRVRVTVEVFGKGSYSGIGRNYRIAKCTAAKCALKQLKRKGLLEKRK